MVMRITGLASGMNIDDIVDSMIKAESIPLNKIKQEKTTLEWKRDDYREMNTLLLDFRSELTNMKLSSFYRTRSVTSTDESLVSASVSSGAGKGTYSISEITQLATAASKVTNKSISGNPESKIDLTKSLYSQRNSFASQSVKTISKEDVNIKTSTTEIKFDQSIKDNISILKGITIGDKTYDVDTETSEISSDGNKIGNLDLEAGMITLDFAVQENADIKISSETPPDNYWKTGSVESQTIVVTDQKPIKLTLEDGIEVKTDAFGSFSIEVDGKKFKAVSGEGPQENEVKISSDGTLTFNNGVTIKPNSTIKVNFVTDQAVRSQSIAENATEIQLGQTFVEGSSIFTGFMMNGQKFELGKEEDNSNILYLINEDGTNGQKVGSYIDDEEGTRKIQFDVEKFSTFLKDAADKSSSTSNPKTVQIKVYSEETYTDFSITTHDENGKENKENILIKGSDSLNNVISKVNGSNAGVTMFYDSYSDKMTMTRNITGNLNEAGDEIKTSGTFINNILGFGGVKESGGQNAEFTINGLNTQRTSNTFSMNGVTFTLKNTTETGSTKNTTINVNNNNDQLFENIKSFVDKYNEIIGKIEEKLKEPFYKDYKPLADYERETLSDKQQEKWEEMARSGLLRNDSILSGLVNSMRMAIYSTVNQGDLDSSMRSLSAIGISTTADYNSAKLEINESKLKEAINKDPQSIELLFNGAGNTEGQKGIIQRLYDRVNATMDQLKNRAGNTFSINHQFTIGRQLESIDNEIERFEDRLGDLETRYYRQFTAMEKAIAQANSQAGYLAQMFM